MEQLLEQSQSLSIEEIRKNPELITQLLLQEQDVSVLLEKRGDQVSYAYLKTYDKESVRILQEAKAEYKQLKEKGYNRQQALKEFEETHNQLNQLINPIT